MVIASMTGTVAIDLTHLLTGNARVDIYIDTLT